jgi:transcriptional regulator with XRE-family HTH domain
MARAALNWSTAKLAEAAGVGLNTVNRFEAGSDTRTSSVDKMRRILECAGVEFTNGGQPGVRLKLSTDGSLRVVCPECAFEVLKGTEIQFDAEAYQARCRLSRSSFDCPNLRTVLFSLRAKSPLQDSETDLRESKSAAPTKTAPAGTTPRRAPVGRRKGK